MKLSPAQRSLGAQSNRCSSCMTHTSRFISARDRCVLARFITIVGCVTLFTKNDRLGFPSRPGRKRLSSWICFRPRQLATVAALWVVFVAPGSVLALLLLVHHLLRLRPSPILLLVQRHLLKR